MAIHVSAGELREDLTALSRRVHGGEILVIDRRARPPVVLRRFRSGDRGQRVPLTRFRRQLHRVLRDVYQHPVVVTVDGTPTFWVGPDPAVAPDPVEEWWKRMREEASAW